MSREDARWAIGLIVGLGVLVCTGFITWQQGLGLLGYFVWFSVMFAAGIFFMLVCMALTGVGFLFFEWFHKGFPRLGPLVGRLLYGVLSLLILVFAAVIAWHVAWDMVGLLRDNPGMFLLGLLGVFWFPLVGGLVMLAWAIWRRYRPERSSPGQAAGPKESDVMDAEFEDLGEPPQPGKSGRREG